MLSGAKKSNMNQSFVSQGTNVLYQPGLRNNYTYNEFCFV